MESSHGPKPHVCFEVEKVIGISSDGSYRVQWAPAWVSKFHLVGCEHLIQEFLQQQCEKDKEHTSERTLVSNESNQLPLEENETNTDAGDEFEQPDKAIIRDSDSLGDTIVVQKHVSASGLSVIWPLVGDGRPESGTQREGNSEGHLISTSTDHDSPHSSLTMACKDQQEIEHTFSFNTSNIDVQVKDEEEMMVVYPSDCTDNTIKQENLSPSKSNPSKTATRILPMSDQNRTYVVCPVSNHTKTPATTSGTTKLPLEDIVRKISSAALHDMGPMESPSFSRTTVKSAQSPSDGTLSATAQGVGGHKPHVCGYCGKSYTLKHHLTWHIRSHTGEKPYQCHVCEKAFSRNNILKEHLRTHYERETYTCDVCNRPFKQKHALKKHQLTHTGV